MCSKPVLCGFIFQTWLVASCSWGCVLQYYLCLYGVILDITDVMASCSQWSAFGPHCPGPRCSEATTFKGDFLPIREEIFFAFAQANDSVFAQQAQQQACSGGPPRNNKRKARRRR